MKVSSKIHSKLKTFRTPSI